MNMIKKFFSIIQIPIKLLLIAIMIFMSYEYLSKVFKNQDVSYGGDFRSLPKNSLDVLVLGSSDAQYSFVPSFFFEDTGLYSYVRGTPCQPLEVSYEMLKESLKTQHPKVVFLEVFTALPLRSICEDDVCYVVAQYQMTGQEKYNTINYLPEDKAKEYRSDFINYHNDWRIRDDYESLLPSNVYNKQKNPDTYFGYVYQNFDGNVPNNYWFPSIYDDDIEISIDQLDLISLNNIYSLCQERNIELILYKTPIDGITQEDQSMLHKVWEWAKEKNINYIDFISLSKELKFYMQIHSDSFHSNINGASIITGYLADYINENYDFNHFSNKYLDRLYETEVCELTKSVLNSEYDPLVYLKRLVNTKGIICIRYNPKTGAQIGQGLYNAICELGCTYFDIKYPYYAVIKDGELLYENFESSDFEYEDIKIQLHNDLLSIDDNIFEINGPISIAYTNENNPENCVIKNIDYIPFPWDCDQEVYKRP